jgi:hypothetical protein
MVKNKERWHNASRERNSKPMVVDSGFWILTPLLVGLLTSLLSNPYIQIIRDRASI